MKRKRMSKLAVLGLCLWLLLGCTVAEELQATPTLPPLPTLIVGGTVPVLPTITPLPADSTLEPPVLSDPTSQPAATLIPEATSETTTQPTTDPTTEPTSQPTNQPNGETLQPGQSVLGNLAGGASQTYPYQGVRFSPRLFFAQPEGSLDVAVRAYPAGVNLSNVSAANPATEVNFFGAGVPEMSVYTPQADEVHLLAVASSGNTAGQYRLYLFDATTQTGNTAVLEQTTLTPNTPRTYPINSPEGHPIIVFADPVGTTEDIALTVREATSGNIINQANFGGGGSAEALYILPQRTATYTIELSEANNQTATVNMHIIILSAPNFALDE
jgi:hypothetical protein